MTISPVSSDMVHRSLEMYLEKNSSKVISKDYVKASDCVLESFAVTGEKPVQGSEVGAEEVAFRATVSNGRFRNSFTGSAYYRKRGKVWVPYVLEGTAVAIDKESIFVEPLSGVDYLKSASSLDEVNRPSTLKKSGDGVWKSRAKRIMEDRRWFTSGKVICYQDYELDGTKWKSTTSGPQIDKKSWTFLGRSFSSGKVKAEDVGGASGQVELTAEFSLADANKEYRKIYGRALSAEELQNDGDLNVQWGGERGVACKYTLTVFRPGKRPKIIAGRAVGTLDDFEGIDLTGTLVDKKSDVEMTMSLNEDEKGKVSVEVSAKKFSSDAWYSVYGCTVGLSESKK